MLATTTFWFIKVENILVIFQAVYRRRHVSRDHLSALAQDGDDLPRAGGLRGDGALGGACGPVDPGGIGRGSVAMAAGMLVGSRAFWLWGVRRYSGASGLGRLKPVTLLY